MPRIEFVFFDAGGGHRAAATALQSVISAQGRPWEIQLLNLQELLDSIDPVRKLTGIRVQDVYNQMLRRGWTLGSASVLRVLHAAIRVAHEAMVRRLETYWKESRPDMAVSLVPNFNRALRESFARAFPSRPFVTILTDLADYPPHFWIEREEQYFICGSPRAVEQARAIGHRASRVFQTSGMILNPAFYEDVRLDRAAERNKLGLDADRRTGLLLFGGHGSNVMLEIARRLDRSGLDIQLILICGKNDGLFRALRAQESGMPRFVEGFTTQIPFYMRLSDFFIGKPGPGSVSEAVTMGLPVVVECNAATLPQERYNAAWIRENGAGIVTRNFREVASAVRQLLEPQNFEELRRNARALQSRAVFEIPDILASCSEEAPTESAWAKKAGSTEPAL